MLDEESGGARNYGIPANCGNARLSIWHWVDQMGDKFPGFIPYNYKMNNPVRFIVPSIMEPDDIIFNILKEDLTSNELGRIVTDKFEITSIAFHW